MAGQGGESIPGLDPRPAQVVNADQGHASLYSSLTPGNQSWSLSTGQSVSSSVFPYDPQSQLSVSANSQSGNYSVSHASIPPTLGSASVTNEYSGYPSYSSSSVPYTYSSSSTDYQNYYYNYPQPVHQSSAQQVDPNPNTGAAYQPLSSFQNSGSYVSPPSYLSTYYNAGDYQTTSGYGQSSNNYQNNSRNDGNYGNYQSQHYANYASTDTNSTQSSTTANSLYYQQQYNQWPYYYSHPAPITNGTSGSENVTSFANSLPAGYSTAGASGGYSYVSNQPPPPGTTSWRNESVSSVPSSQGKDTGTAYALNNGLESSALVSQSQNTNQSYVQMPPVSNFQNENHESEQKLFYSQAPSLQHSCSNQVPQNLQQQPHPAFTTDAHQVSKVQIMVNPRIAPNLGFGMLKSQKENSATHAAVKPAYVSVSLPKVDSKPASQDDAQGTAKGKLPASLCAYVDRAFARCKDDAQRSASQNIMKEIITKATEEGTLYAKNWDTEPLFPLPSSSSNIIDQSNSQNLVSGSFLPKVTRSPGRRIKSRWEPVPEEKVGDTFSPVNIEALSKVSNFSGWNGVKFVASQQQSPLNKISQSPRKKLRISDSSNLGNGDASGDSDKEQGLTKFHASAITLASSAEERKRREHRFKRFEKGQGNKVEMNHLKSKSTEGAYVYAKRPSTTLYVKKYEDVSSVAVEDINWDSLTVKGTCQEIEKRYLRLTSAPDPATVRPEDVLEKALEMVQSSKKNYLYKCDQLKSIRQDLTVQRIQNTFTAKVYETHARFALEAGDLHEYNQCQSQLKRLYSEGIDGNHKEFSAYNLLYIILHTNNKRDLLSSLTRLSYEAKADEAVKHALAVRGAVSSGNYILFFRLYKEAPNLNACLMDLYTEKMRFEAIKCMCKSYRPVVPVPYVSRVLGFSKLSENGDSKVVVDGTEDCEEWLKAHGAVVTVDNNEERQLDTKASSSSLYMPEPEDAVAHGDASLGVDDFLARASQTPVL